MQILRKVQKSKWRPSELNDDPSSIPADALSRCLSSTNNSLSIWVFEEGELEDAILACAAHSTRSSFDTLDFVILDERQVQDLDIEKNPGDTSYKNFEEKHRDLINLNATTLVMFASQVSISLRDKSRSERLTAKKLRALIIKALDEGKSDMTDLHIEMQKKIKEYKEQSQK
jgi:hypothetical protein